MEYIEDIESPGISEKQHAEFPEVNSKQSGTFGSDQEKIMWNGTSNDLGIWVAVELPRDITQFYGISWDLALVCLEIAG